MSGYEAALRGCYAEGRPDAIESRTVRSLVRMSLGRRWRHLAAERLESVRPTLPLGRRFWRITAEERAAIVAMFEERTLHDLIGALQQNEHADVEVVDAAYWMKGCSSLGRLRYAVMLRVGHGRAASMCLVDIKEGVAAAAPRAPDADVPRDNAIRVVTAAKAMSPYLGERMMACRLLGKGVVLRELMPQDLKLEIDTVNEREMLLLAEHLANVVGRAHGRQMDDENRAAWSAELQRARSSTIDAPTWLWKGVVERVGIHEAAYLEHCRRYALQEAA